MIGSPQQLGVDPVREAQALAASAAARPATAPTPACCRRSATSTRSSPRSSATASCPSSPRPTSTRCPNWIGDDGRLHTTFEQTTAATGRLSSINPNLQNIPIRTETGREIRACFIAEPGNVLLSRRLRPGRAARARPHRQRAGAARHLRRAARTCTPRPRAPSSSSRPSSSTSACARKAKMVNYGIVYGLSAYGLADRLRIPQEEAQEFIDRYLERFPAVAQFMKDAVEQAEQHGYVSHAVRPPPPDPRDPRPQLAGAQARRAARGQHRDPGHRRRHHQGRDGPLPRRARRGGAEDQA